MVLQKLMIQNYVKLMLGTIQQHLFSQYRTQMCGNGTEKNADYQHKLPVNPNFCFCEIFIGSHMLGSNCSLQNAGSSNKGGGCTQVV